MGNSGSFPRRKPAATESRFPTYGACMMGVGDPPDSDVDYRMFNVRTDINAYGCTRGVYGHT